MKKLVQLLFAIAVVLALNPGASAVVQEMPADMLRGPTAPIHAGTVAESEEFTAPPGQQSLHVLGVTQNGQFIRQHSLPTVIAPVAQDAVQRAPEWLRMDLYDMFYRMSTSQQENWGQMIVDIEDARLIDEVVFTVAHSAKDVLTGSSPDLYLRNAELMYQIDEEIAYADIVDYGTPGVDDDYYSTVRYSSIRGGTMRQYELPRDIYYWYVVHPKLGDEAPSDSPAITDRTSTYGYLWREFLFYNPSEDYDFTRYYVNKAPNTIADADIDNWGPSATGYLTDASKKFRAAILMAGDDPEKPLLCEYPWNMSRVIVTTMNAELAYTAGKRKMLENLVMRSNGIGGELISEGHYVAVVDDTDDPSIVGPITDILDANDVSYELHVSDDLRIKFWSRFSKVIIASNQSRAFYETLAEAEVVSMLQSLMNDHYITFEFHGACAPGDDWAGLDMPFGLGYVAEATNDVAIGHYPTLQEVIGNASHLWDDSVVDTSLAAFRPFEPDSMAVDVVSNWVCRNLPFRARDNRPVQPNQICFEHNGNCGEIQDLMNAAARTCMLPCAGVNNHTWDHVSNEFWEQDWHGYQVDWNGNHSSIAKQSVLYDKDFGGGKDLSAILQDIGDTYPVNATSRFSKVCKFHIRVEDVQGNPVDGAYIIPKVHLYNNPEYQLYPPLTAYTGSSGELVMDLGNNRDFWFEIRSRIGNSPESLILTATVEDEDYYHTWVLEGLMPDLPPVESSSFPSGVDDPYKLDISFDVDHEMLYSLSAGTFGHPGEDGNVDFFIATPTEYAKYERDETFLGYEWLEDAKTSALELEMPGDETYYFVFSNEDTLSVKQFVKVNIDVNKRSGGSWQLLESYSDYVAIPAGQSYVLEFKGTQTNLGPPQVFAAGYLNAYVDPSSDFEFGMQALVYDPDGAADVSEVELHYGGIPLGIYLTDNGIEPDSVPGDGIFTSLQQMLPGSLASGLYKLELIATDSVGNESSPWPYLNVLSGPLFSPSGASLMNVDLWQPEATAPDAPIILGGGFFGGESVGPGDLMKIQVFVTDPNGLDDVDRVELFLEGGLATGFSLSDDGANGDDHAGDGIFTFQTLLPGGLTTGHLTLEVVAFDRSGNSSATFPYFTVM